MKPHLFRRADVWHCAVPNEPHSCKRGFSSRMGFGYTVAEAIADWRRLTRPAWSTTKAKAYADAAKDLARAGEALAPLTWPELMR